MSFPSLLSRAACLPRRAGGVLPHIMTHMIELATGRLEITVNTADMAPGALTGFAARNNPRRGFLFVSRVLGKHIPVRPSLMRRTHCMLAHKLPEDLPHPLLCVGMAETATALGQGVFEARSAEAPGEDLYMHTTRYRLGGSDCLTFDESHSHAARHFLHLPQDPALRRLFTEARTLVLVDDEISTGNTFAHLAQVVRTQAPHLRRVVVVTLLNWLTPTNRRELSRRFPCPVTFVQLLEGSFRFTPDPAFRFGPAARSEAEPVCRNAQLSLPGGRRGARAGSLSAVPAFRPRLGLPERSGSVLVLGSGEFMYAPFQLALELEEAGYDVWFQATTRSPVLPGGDIGHVLQFEDNYGEGIDNFLYNVRPGQYDQVLACYETTDLPPGHTLLRQLGAHVVLFSAGGASAAASSAPVVEKGATFSLGRGAGGQTSFMAGK